MTLPDERARAVIYTRRFLFDLINPKKFRRVPKQVREIAYNLLKHYPGESELVDLLGAKLTIEDVQPFHRPDRTKP